MIDSLRKKVFWSILLSASAVLLVILLAINVLGLAQTTSKKESILDSAQMMLSQDASIDKGRGKADGKGKGELLRSVSEGELGVFLLDGNGAVTSKMGCAASLDDNTIDSIVKAVLADKDDVGNVGGWDYKILNSATGKVVSILDAASLRNEDLERALLSLGAFAAACCLFGLVARFLSKTIVKPVEDNMQMQKRFVADASHELKTPLTVIDANASVLEQSIGENKWLDYIKEQTGRMSGLVNELLQLSNLEAAIETGKQDQKEPYDAAEALMSATLPFESVAFEQGLTLESDAPDSLNVVGNRKEFEQLTAILTDNAIKHATPGGTIDVVLKEIGQMMELSVSNPGEDIPPEALPHLFDRFYKVDESRTHKDNSYGLGLAIAKGLAEKNKGNISVSSKDGITRFSFQMPVK